MAGGVFGCFDPEPFDGSGTEATPSTSDPTDTDPTDATGTTGNDTATTDVTETASMSTTDDSSSATCDACIAAAPEGWEGPLILGENAASCAGGFTAQAFSLDTDIAGDDAECTCACGTGTVECGDMQLRYNASCGAGASGGIESFGGADTCHDNTAGAAVTTPFFFPLSGTEACDPEATVSLPDTTSTSLLLCAGAFSQDECSADEVCVSAVPDGFNAELCIAQEGSHTCPDSYPNERTGFDGISDSRGCSECECDPGDDFVCSATMQIYGDDGCSVGGTSTQTDECVNSFESFTYAEPTTSGSCTPSGVQAEGSVSGADPVTICCQ